MISIGKIYDERMKACKLIFLMRMFHVIISEHRIVSDKVYLTIGYLTIVDRTHDKNKLIILLYNRKCRLITVILFVYYTRYLEGNVTNIRYATKLSVV